MIHHIENSRKVDAVVPELPFDFGYMGDGGPLQIACFLVGTDTSSGSKKVDMLHVVAGDNHGVFQWLLGKLAKECRPDERQDLKILRQVSPTQNHQSNGAAEKAVSTIRGLARTYSPMLPWTIRHAEWILT